MLGNEADQVDRARAGVHELGCVIDQRIELSGVETWHARSHFQGGFDAQDDPALASRDLPFLPASKRLTVVPKMRRTAHGAVHWTDLFAAAMASRAFE